MYSRVHVCLESLPNSIEAYLDEAGFSGTEMAILKKLLEEDALTLRELASKTGKSTGVLDQAVKKLVKKRIVGKEIINDTPKYVLRSLNSILAWMQEDMELKQELMKRRHENFESFIKSLTVTKKRPEMEYFEGIEGLKKAYMELLSRGNDIIQYGPTVWLAEEDPLRDFRVQYFRDKRNRGIFSRVITHNTMLGRRFQSRDPFEFRKTILVEPESYPFNFEKVIVGDTVACFQLEDERACFIRYPELADSERAFFERIWNKKIENEVVSDEEDAHVNTEGEKVLPIIDIQPVQVPFKTKLYSQMREFFLSRKSIAAFAAFGVVAAALTYGLYRYNVAVNTEHLKEKVLSIAATGAVQFDAAELEKIRVLADTQKPEYAKLVYLLNQIRNQNEGVKYVYLMRPRNGYVWEFIADADSADPYVEEDVNKDGVIDPVDDKGYPGVLYDAYPTPVAQALYGPTAFDPSVDQWGYLITAWAPIKDAEGKVVAILGVDRMAEDVYDLSQNSFVPAYWFIGLFALFIIIRLAAFNRSLFQELINTFKSRKYFWLLIAGAVLTAIAIIATYYYIVENNVRQARERAISIAATGALQFSAEELDQLHTLRDAEKPIYKTMVEKLQAIRSGNENIKYAYIIRPKKDTTTFEFIADADSSFPINLETDVDGNGVIDASDEMAYPGLQYDVGHIDILREGTYFNPVATEEPYTDKWGTVFTGYAPIYYSNGEIAGILAIDIDAMEIYAPSIKILVPLLVFVAGVLIFLLFKAPGYKSSLFRELMQRFLTRKVLMISMFVLMGAYWLTFALYFYTLDLMKEQTGRRLMSIAATAASQINPDDLENLRFARDMRRPEYQRVFKQLNEIRDNNRDFTYAYIMRPTEVPGIWEFVVDADANYYIPFDGIDYTKDGQVNQEDENVAPGVRYVISAWPSVAKEGLLKPTYDSEIIIDQWGAVIGGSAPIYNIEGQAIAVLGIDVNINEMIKKIQAIYYPIIYCLLSVLLINILAIYRHKYLEKD